VYTCVVLKGHTRTHGMKDHSSRRSQFPSLISVYCVRVNSSRKSRRKLVFWVMPLILFCYETCQSSDFIYRQLYNLRNFESQRSSYSLLFTTLYKAAKVDVFILSKSIADTRRRRRSTNGRVVNVAEHAVVPPSTRKGAANVHVAPVDKCFSLLIDKNQHHDHCHCHYKNCRSGGMLHYVFDAGIPVI